jgi:hypothetical protein
MTSDQYEQEFECSFEAAILGAYYGKEMREAEDSGRMAAVPWDRNMPVYTAWDLGYHDDTAIWFYQVINTEIHLIDYYAASGLSVDDYAKEVTGKPYKYAKHWLPHDARAKTLASGGRSIIEQLGEKLGGPGLMSIAPNLSVQDGIQAVRMMLPRCWFDRENTYEATELLKQYQREWDEDRKAFRDKPRHDNTSHCADALRMLAVSWQHEKPKNEQKPDIFAIKGVNGRIITQPLDVLWAETHKRHERY